MPFSGLESQKRLTFPPPSPSLPKIRAFDDLVEFTKEYRSRQIGTDPANKDSNMTVKIWLRSRPASGSSPLVSDPLSVRVSIRDTVNIFIKLRHLHEQSNDGQLLVESAVAFGPREQVKASSCWNMLLVLMNIQKPASSYSDFTVYQKLSQQMTRMLERDPTVSIGQFMVSDQRHNGPTASLH